MDEDEARKIAFSTRKPMEAAHLLRENDLISLVDQAGRWYRIEFSYADFRHFKLIEIPAPKPEPIAEQFSELLKRGDLLLENSADLRAKGGKRTIFGNYTGLANKLIADVVDKLDASVATLTEAADWKWQRALSKVKYEIDDMVADHQARLLVREMATSRVCAFPSQDGEEAYSYRKRPIRTTPTGEIVISRAKPDSYIEYDVAIHAERMGLVGEVLLNEEEVYVLTTEGFKEAGVVPGPKDVVAPENWKDLHDERRRVWWTRIAKEQQVLVRFRKYEYREEDDDPNEELRIGEAKGDIVIGVPGSFDFAAQRPGQPFKWWQRHGVPADPFTRNEYSHVDELVADLLADGRYVTDLRKCVGEVSDMTEAMRLLREGMVVQSADDDMYLLHPRVNLVHGDLLMLSWELGRQLLGDKTIVPALAFKTDYHYEKLYALPDHPLVAALAEQKSAAKARKPDTSEVVGYDDDGAPITMNEIERESYRRIPEGATFALLAPFDYPGGEDQFEIDQYAEHIRIRRRQAKNATAD